MAYLYITSVKVPYTLTNINLFRVWCSKGVNYTSYNYQTTLRLAPVVKLQDGVKLGGNEADGSELKPWSLSI